MRQAAFQPSSANARRSGSADLQGLKGMVGRIRMMGLSLVVKAVALATAAAEVKVGPLEVTGVAKEKAVVRRQRRLGRNLSRQLAVRP
jgi:hypothetical protein